MSSLHPVLTSKRCMDWSLEADISILLSKKRTDSGVKTCSECIKSGFDSAVNYRRSHSLTSAPSLLKPLWPVASRGMSLSDRITSQDVMKFVPTLTSNDGLKGLYLTSHILRVRSSLPSKKRFGWPGTHFIAVTTFLSIFLLCSCFCVSMSHNLVV